MKGEIMKKKIIILTCLIIYLVSATYSYKYFNIAYSEGGRWQHISPTFEDVVVTILPIMNTIIALDYTTDSMYTNRHKPDRGFYGKIFKVRK
jgi:hypothetical protein